MEKEPAHLVEGVVMNLELGVDALRLIDTLAQRGCEGRVKSMFPEQRCTHLNPCLTCKAKRVNAKLEVLPQHPSRRR